MYQHIVNQYGAKKNARRRTGGRNMSDTRYAQVARDLMAGIGSGLFPVGSVLPTELELCVQYQASRNTIRAALKELQELGLVSRKKKTGTRVEASSPQGGYRHSLASVEDLMQFGEAHVREVHDITEVVADRALAKVLGCAVGSKWLRTSSLRLDGKGAATPIGWTDVYIDHAYADLGPDIRNTPGTLISSLIEERYGRRIAEIRQDIEATLVPKSLADRLQVDAGTPALKIVRHYLDPAGVPFEISVTLHPAGRFTFGLRLRREKVLAPGLAAP